MSANGRYDVIVIGTGAGGGTLLHRLAPTGKRILVLERGDFVARERENWDSRAVNVEARYNTKETWFDRAGKPLHPHTNYYVGGNTKFYGAALFRFRKEDFEYLAPRDGQPAPADLRANDLGHWQTRLLVADAEEAGRRLAADRLDLVSPGTVAVPDGKLGFRRALLVRDPDGHALQLVETDAAASAGEAAATARSLR